MLPPPPLHRLTLPSRPVPPPRAPFPLAATLAPVIVSLGIWAVTGSPYSLLFAALGPVVALGSLVDGRRQRRRVARREREGALAGVERTGARLEQLHDDERRRLRALAPGSGADLDPSSVAARWAATAREEPGGVGAVVPVRLGRIDLPPIVEPVSPDEGQASGLDDEPVARAVDALRAAAEVLTGAPWVIDARDGIGLLGPPLLAGAVARGLALQVAASVSPAVVTLAAPGGESWARVLPHAVSIGQDGAYRFESLSGEAIVIAWAEQSSGPPVTSSEPVRLDRQDGEPIIVAVSRIRARGLADRLRRQADDLGIRAAARTLPDAVDLRALLDEPHGRHGMTAVLDGVSARLAAPIGRDADGVVELDLVRDGPHAVVAGTTGTGKSELLVTWVLAMAARHPPDRVTFLLVDFKGGAAFAPLTGLPHVVGIVSDLDARRSRRAIESLRAELLRRESLLADRGARSLDDLAGSAGAPARLVIVVDEFAAVVAGQPELHEVFADLASRGRSLGLHLVLCTQRPAGVIRDGVLANVTLRISLRVLDRGDSIAMLDGDAAARLPLEPRGRAVIADGSGALREVQLAIASPGEADRIGASVEGMPRPDRVWCEPLPDRIPLAELLADASDGDADVAIPFGRLDLPAEQRQPVARWDPELDGHLLVLGGARSGVTNALAVLGGSAARVLPSAPADAWSVLDEVEREVQRDGESAGDVLVIDDLDELIERFEPDARQEFVDRLGRVARALRGARLLVGARRLAGPLSRLAGSFPERLLLRQPNRDEHVLAGGDVAAFDPRASAGSGTWRGAVVQVALAAASLPAPVPVGLVRVQATAGEVLAIVGGRPRELAHRFVLAGARVLRVGEEAIDAIADLLVVDGPATTGRPLVLVGDADAWQADWNLLIAVRREHPLVFVGCAASELRAVARVRDIPPPLGPETGECWLVVGGEVRRALLEVP